MTPFNLFLLALIVIVSQVKANLDFSELSEETVKVLTHCNVDRFAFHFLMCKSERREDIKIKEKDLSNINHIYVQQINVTDEFWTLFPNVSEVTFVSEMMQHQGPTLASLEFLKYLPKLYMFKVYDVVILNQTFPKLSGEELTVLELSNCSWKSLNGLEGKNLKDLALDNNLIEDLEGSLVDLPNLKHFDASDNHISRITDETFNCNKNLQVIDLSKNRIESISKMAFSSLKDLVALYLSITRITEFEVIFNLAPTVELQIFLDGSPSLIDMSGSQPSGDIDLIPTQLANWNQTTIKASQNVGLALRLCPDEDTYQNVVENILNHAEGLTRIFLRPYFNVTAADLNDITNEDLKVLELESIDEINQDTLDALARVFPNLEKIIVKFFEKDFYNGLVEKVFEGKVTVEPANVESPRWNDYLYI